MKKTMLLALGAMLLAGCAPAKLVTLSKPTESNQSTLLVYRESAFNSGGADAVFGASQKDWVALSNGSFTVLQVEPAKYEFFVRSTQGDQPFALSLLLGQAETKCLRLFPNPGNFAKALVPISYAVGNTFMLEESACPGPGALAKLDTKTVTYGK